MRVHRTTKWMHTMHYTLYAVQSTIFYDFASFSHLNYGKYRTLYDIWWIYHNIWIEMEMVHSFYTHMCVVRGVYLDCVTQLTTETIIFSSPIFHFSIVILLTRKCFVLFSKLEWKMFQKCLCLVLAGPECMNEWLNYKKKRKQQQKFKTQNAKCMSTRL